MIEPTFLGLAKSQWDFFNSFSNWLSALATLAAVLVSLHLANRASSQKAKVSVGHRIIIEPGTKGPIPEFVVFKIVNTGERVLRITQIGWKVGAIKKRYAIQTYDESISSKMPIELAHGQEAVWFVPLGAHDEPWLSYFSKRMLMLRHCISRNTLRAQFYSSLGNVFVAKPEDNLLSKLRSTCHELVQGNL